MFHKHNWEMIDKTVIPAAIDGREVSNVKGGYGIESFLDAMRDKVVHVFKCECGKVKVVKN